MGCLVEFWASLTLFYTKMSFKILKLSYRLISPENYFPYNTCLFQGLPLQESFEVLLHEKSVMRKLQRVCKMYSRSRVIMYFSTKKNFYVFLCVFNVGKSCF
jgi:hypothetical protein